VAGGQATLQALLEAPSVAVISPHTQCHPVPPHHGTVPVLSLQSATDRTGLVLWVCCVQPSTQEGSTDHQSVGLGLPP
jgi:hypothetical protein